MVFPALYAMEKRGVLEMPVVGVAFSDVSLAQLRERAEDGIRNSGRIDDKRALRRLLARLSYINGDYKDAEHVRRRSSRHSAAPAVRRTTSRSRPRSSRRSSRGSAPPACPNALASSSKSRSVAISPRRAT